ncbi:hypothetical protein GEV33_012623 [Tenebrio molitor]|uniref:Uncharacterized protein n=1 Tax=Tenebrio molitor TaxID=7067 RepID=A0A8J6L750_TENMO|nr:hypothetical protein GEV33_012623 [Tenebrio molitor]
MITEQGRLCTVNGTRRYLGGRKARLFAPKDHIVKVLPGKSTNSATRVVSERRCKDHHTKYALLEVLVVFTSVPKCGFWTRRVEESSTSPPWLVETTGSASKDHHFADLLGDEVMANEDLREIIRIKAEKHREYYKSLTGNRSGELAVSRSDEEMAPQVANNEEASDDGGSKERIKRQRRTGVYEIKNYQDGTIFQSVKLLRENYMAMLHRTVESFRKEEKREESLLLPPTSGYSTGASDDEREKNWENKNKVQRCGSSDSAMGHSEDESTWREKKETDCEPYSYVEPVKSPYSPRGSIDHDNVPSRTLIESQFVPLPLDRKFSDCVSDSDYRNDSRRQSCFTDDGDEPPRYRYWRTPSVVVSDYSDDIMGLTLEDIEYIRNHRKENSSSPDSSLHSSCSNLNYCGSTISSLESEYVLRKPFRKSSNCSTCSTLSDEEGDGLLPVKKEGRPLRRSWVINPTCDRRKPTQTEVGPPQNQPRRFGTAASAAQCIGVFGLNDSSGSPTRRSSMDSITIDKVRARTRELIADLLCPEDQYPRVPWIGVSPEFLRSRRRPRRLARVNTLVPQGFFASGNYSSRSRNGLAGKS